ncbi:hypothetical protein OGAPHI_000807 [Ogataea philodendri]|uniref:Uncharacterized protein n=1 Tax=Ogataea philodendri TaxID=1378263 RepID=A0A9P8PFR0_9ASCO|nr:uncharacterized protein OGAPHI_000807 [Ogataea philodendri]KAH3671096.1 hypothetical protein OGAPHI_000807 [Ogataea philodendri]
MILQLQHDSLLQLVSDAINAKLGAGPVEIVDLLFNPDNPVKLPRLSIAQLEIFSTMKYTGVAQFSFQCLFRLLTKLQYTTAATVVVHGLWDQLSLVYSEILTTPEPSLADFGEYRVSIIVLILYKLKMLAEQKTVVLSDSSAVVDRLGAIFLSQTDQLADLKQFKVSNLVSAEQLARQYGVSISGTAGSGPDTGSAAG